MGNKRKRESEPTTGSSHKKQDPNIIPTGPDQTSNFEPESHNGTPQHGPIPSHTPSSPSISFPKLPSVPPGYLSTAPFLHNSAVTSSRISAAQDSSYERLEFLGDAYIEVIATRIIYSRFPQFPSGKLANTRENLVCNNSLANFSRKYGFDQKVTCTPSVMDDPAFYKVVADVFEAYVAAVILGDPEHGFEIAEAWLTALWEPQLAQIEKAAAKSVMAANAKEELRRKIMSPGVKIEYLETRSMQYNKAKGESHFYYGCYVTGWGYEKKRLGTGTGTSKSAAGNNAAQDAMENEPALLKDMAKQKAVFDEKRRQEREMATA
ncbi:hypothetical protein EV356DRAFT_505855 [Viridothelium virens]|uniref:Uncharacterized protein n=1 Tax=Viridothelium virens TaxID=1048519 RepID=A0A6A6HLY4_VIRVR|nr:hypothetical protein EV356DRAFT_505855 [Viridothelium virens]